MCIPREKGVKLQEVELEEGLKVVLCETGWELLGKQGEEVKLSMPTVADTYEVSLT